VKFERRLRCLPANKFRLACNAREGVLLGGIVVWRCTRRDVVWGKVVEVNVGAVVVEVDVGAVVVVVVVGAESQRESSSRQERPRPGSSRTDRQLMISNGA